MSLPTDYAERKTWQMWTFLTEYFPDAFEEVVRVAIKGNEQHNKGEPLHWARDKSTDQMNTAFRHMWDHTTQGMLDTDGCYHLAKAIWRLSAELQLRIEAVRAEFGGVPLRPAPGTITVGTVMYECATPRCGNRAVTDEGNDAPPPCVRCGASRWSRLL